jgi:hypothetical protein
MSHETLRKRLAVWLFLGNGLTFTSFLFFLFIGGLDSSDLALIAPVVMPLFAVYASKVLSFALRATPVSGSPRRVNKVFAIICESIVALFSLLVPILIVCRSLFLISDTKVLLVLLGLTQTALAAYLGTIFDWLYDTKEAD